MPRMMNRRPRDRRPPTPMPGPMQGPMAGPPMQGPPPGERRMPMAGGRPPGLATPPMQGPMPGPPSPEVGPVEDMGRLIGQIVEGFRAYRDVYWPSVQEFATEGREELTGENVREAWGEFLDMLRDAFDRFEF